MIVNPGKFQAMIINRFGKKESKHKMYIYNKKITEDSVKVLKQIINKNLTIMYQNYAKKQVHS